MQARRGKILIVDDEWGACELICQELSEHGYDCQVDTDPQHAKELLVGGQFDLAICDILMPRISGLDLLAHTRKYAPACKVILVTGASKREYVAQALMLGAYDYVAKPFGNGQLVEAVRCAMAESDMSALTVRAAAAMELSEQARKAAFESVLALVRAVEAKDPYTRRHSVQVTHYAVNLSRALGLDDATVESIRTAALLHDVGKIGVPDHILTKPGPLTEQEFECICRHPSLGADILANITLFGQEAELVRYHHERWDGKGYPSGLKGEESPLGSRIIMVSDCIDAMLMERTYKKRYHPDKMIAELIRCAGTQFDPRIAATAVQWCRSNADHQLITTGQQSVVSP